MNTYYKNKLYPLQDKVLKVIDGLGTKFYLTGGTALTRCYFNHRYSDDLDFFVNQNLQFQKFSEAIITALRKKFTLNIISRSSSFYSFQVNEILKIDLVNDVASHIGKFKKGEIFSRIDNPTNILSNKVSSIIGREEPKDVVDIWIIWKNEKIVWENIFTDVASKAVGIFPPLVAKKLDTFPLILLKNIKWHLKKPTRAVFSKDLQIIIREILRKKG